MDRLITIRTGALLSLFLALIMGLVSFGSADVTPCNGNPRCVIRTAVMENNPAACDEMSDPEFAANCKSSVKEYHKAAEVEQEKIQKQEVGRKISTVALPSAFFLLVVSMLLGVLYFKQRSRMTSLETMIQKKDMHKVAEKQKQLKHFVGEALEHNYPESWIKQKLVAVGWDKELIEKTINEINSET